MRNFRVGKTWGVLGKHQTYYGPTHFMGEKVPLNNNPFNSWDYKKSNYRRIDGRPAEVQQAGTVPQTISVYSQVLDFVSPAQYNSISYRCNGTQIKACYSSDNQYNITDLVALFNTPPPNPLPGSCTNPSFCYCWTDYGTYYDNGDGKIRLEMPVSLYNTLCPNGTITLDVIYD